ncbi:MAG: hypothetical protein CL468_01190 [Acidimicrobiaceae bacterium]|nr:hypothetical protein [Acidimicrobiaceae bacterium]
MEWIETTGASLDEAKERALDRLGVAEDDLEVEVLAEPSRTMFGLKKSEARLRARVRPTSPRAKVDRRDRKRRSDRNGGQNQGRSSSRKGQENQKGARSSGSSDGDPGQSPRSGDNRRRRSGGKDREVERGSSESKKDQNTQSSETGRNRGRQKAAKESSVKSANGNDRGGDRERTEVEAMDLQTQAQITEGFVQGLLDKMGLDARVASTIDEDRLTVEAQGLNLGLAIGQRGETVRAITELSRTLVQRSSDGQAEGSLIVDIGGYRERRRSFLADFARNQAEEVLTDGRPRALEPMGAADRKVVHDTIGEIDGLMTVSEGSDADRRVMIMVESTG